MTKPFQHDSRPFKFKHDSGPLTAELRRQVLDQVEDMRMRGTTPFAVAHGFVLGQILEGIRAMPLVEPQHEY